MTYCGFYNTVSEKNIPQSDSINNQCIKITEHSHTFTQLEINYWPFKVKEVVE